MKRSTGITFIGLALVMALPTACAKSDGSSGASGDGASAITLGAYPEPDPLYLALEEDLFDPLKVKEVHIDSGPAALSLMKSGDMQVIGAAGLTVIGIALSQDIPVTAVWTPYLTENGIVGVNIDSADELRGKKVGVVSGASSDFWLSSYLEANGMTADDVDVVNVQASSQTAALKSGQIDAASNWPPNITRLMEVPGAVLLDRQGQSSWTLVSNDFLESNPEAVQELVCGYSRAADRYESDPASGANTIASAIDLPVETVNELRPPDTVPNAAAQLASENLGSGAVDLAIEAAEWLVATGAVDSVPPREEFENAFDTTFAQAAADGECA